MDKRDATCGLDSSRELALAVNANHSDICKFGDVNGRVYTIVKENLEELAENIVATAASAAPAAAGA